MHTTPRDLPLLPFFIELSVLRGLDCTSSERLVGEKNGSGDFCNSSPKTVANVGCQAGMESRQAAEPGEDHVCANNFSICPTTDCSPRVPRL